MSADETTPSVTAAGTNAAPVTAAERAKWRRLADEAEQQWSAGHVGMRTGLDFVKAAREAVPRLLAEVERLKVHIERNGIQWCMCSRADRMNERRIPRCPYHGDGMHVQRNVAEQERDAARADAEGYRAMVQPANATAQLALKQRDAARAAHQALTDAVRELAEDWNDDGYSLHGNLVARDLRGILDQHGAGS